MKITNWLGLLPALSVVAHRMTEAIVTVGQSWLFGGSSSSGGGAMTQIGKVTLASNNANITFSNIPATYNSLEIRLQARGDGAGLTQGINLQFNGDGGANYEYIINSNPNPGTTQAAQTSVSASILPANNMTANFAGICTIQVPNYAGTTFNKQLWAVTGSRLNSTGPVDYIATTFGSWNSTAAVSSVALTPSAGNFVTGSVAVLYGVN